MSTQEENLVKKCNICLQILPLEKFRLRSKRSCNKTPYSKRFSFCRKCENWYNKHTIRNAKWNRLAQNLRRHEDGDVTPKQLREILGEPSVCYLCGEATTWEESELDHVVPLSRGGKTTISNLQWAHRRCNRIKHDLPIDELIEHLVKILKHLNA